MTQPTFQELLTSQEARSRANKFTPTESGGSHWMSIHGVLTPTGKDPTHSMAIWQGYLQEAEPPPEPRVFKRVEYRNVYDTGVCENSHSERIYADRSASYGRLACVRVEITATEGQFDD